MPGVALPPSRRQLRVETGIHAARVQLEDLPQVLHRQAELVDVSLRVGLVRASLEAAVETLTDKLEAEIMELGRQIAHIGGALTCIESGWFAQELSDAAC